MKTQNAKLEFCKTAIVELKNSEMGLVNGGSTTFFVDWINDKIDEAHEEMSPWI